MRRTTAAATREHHLALVDQAGPAVTVHGLRKRFKRLEVLRGVDACFSAGRTTALIGPNAAGKSTLLKCVLGLARPDAGRILVGNEVAGATVEYRRSVGYMPQAPRFPEHLTGREVTAMLRDLRGPEAEVDEELFDRFGLAAELDKPVGTLSGGTRQKLNAALALLFRPTVLILDEPTAGLDPVAAGILKEKLAALGRDGVTIIVTSHVLAELEELAEEAVVLLDGRVRFHGTLGQLRRETGEARLERAVASVMTGGALP